MNIQNVITFFAAAVIATGCMPGAFDGLDCRIVGQECAEGFQCVDRGVGLYGCHPEDEAPPPREGEADAADALNDAEAALADAEAALADAETPENLADAEAAVADAEAAIADAAAAADAQADAAAADAAAEADAADADAAAADADAAADAEADAAAADAAADADADAEADQDRADDEPVDDEPVEAPDAAADEGEEPADDEGLSLIGNDFIDEIEEAPDADALRDFFTPQNVHPASIILMNPTAVATNLVAYDGYGPQAIDVNHVSNLGSCIDIRPFGAQMEAFTRASVEGDGQNGHDINNMSAFDAALAAAGLSGADVTISTDQGAEFDPSDDTTWDIMDADADGRDDSEVRIYEGSTDLVIEVDGVVIASGVFDEVVLDIEYQSLVDCQDDNLRAVGSYFELQPAPTADAQFFADALMADLDGRRVRIVSEGTNTSATLAPVNGVATVQLDTLTIETE